LQVVPRTGRDEALACSIGFQPVYFWEKARS
jgi:hypothetical protein